MDQHTEDPQIAKTLDDLLSAEDTTTKTTDQPKTEYKIFADENLVYEGDDWYKAYLAFFCAHEILGAHSVVRWENGLPYCILAYFA